jgi:hypothetical protein
MKRKKCYYYISERTGKASWDYKHNKKGYYKRIKKGNVFETLLDASRFLLKEKNPILDLSLNPVKEIVTDESLAVKTLKESSKGITRYQKYAFDNGSFLIIRSEYPVIEHFRKGASVTITILDEEENRK